MKSVHFVTEQTTQKQRVLIVTEKNDVFVKELKAHLVTHDMNVFISPHIPEDSQHFDLCFIISFSRWLKENNEAIPTIYISFHTQKKHIHKIKPPLNSKLINIIGSIEYAASQIQTIIWFAISKQDHSPILTLESTFHPAPKPKPKKTFQIHFHVPTHLYRLIGITAVFFYLFSFWIPLGVTSYYSFKAAKYIQVNKLDEAKKVNDTKNTSLSFASFLYKPVRPLYLFFSLAQLPDDLFVVNTTETELTQTLEQLINESRTLSGLILQPTRNLATAQSARAHFNKTQQLLNKSEEQILTIYRKVPPYLISNSYRSEFQKGISQLRKAKKVFALLPDLLGEKEEQTTLLLFANNMELRPGGGFIGSYGILKTQYFGIKDLTIFAVYDADGQLTAHVTPPNPIRDYLNQPHWYLRDSAFFPDFYDTYQQATFFLQKEMVLGSWNGAALITTSAVKNIIGAFDEVILPDYNERITKDNFYIKTQYYVEHDFFPGSRQKKSFLSTLVKQLISQTETANPLLLSSAIVEGFDQKNMVLFMNNDKVQKNLDELFWSGRLATPFCPESAKGNCYADFQFALDANLGVNKTNFFIDRTYDVKTSIDDSGLITTNLSITYSNNSLSDVFPGGNYKNYFQVLLPTDSLVTSVQVEGQQLTSYDSETGKQKMIGFLIEIPPQAKKTLSITYNSSIKFKKGKATYQLVLQKQIGAQSNDVHFSLSLPKNVNLLNTNFSPLVKNSLILYNTDLSTDRVFFIELLKEQL
ncbi:MAG: DUF4012 domain-containing protein [Candidatus Roizmanbacteria bacterium]|nr:DUF4012 domain-containing protein [Candidatus Roizmanbacteria bacterium]